MASADVCGIDGLAFSDNIEAIYVRKLFTSNAGGAALAYLGRLLNCHYIHEALEIPEIRKDLTDLLNAAKQALVASFRKTYVASRTGIGALTSVWRFTITMRS